MRVSKVARRLHSIAKSVTGLKLGHRRFSLPFAPVPSLQEPWMADVISLLIPEFPGAFLDVGANLGQTLLYLRSVDRERPYLGFEPNVNCVAYIHKLIELNGFKNTHVIPAACALDYGLDKLYFYLDSPFDTSASLIENFRPSQQIQRKVFVVSVPAVPSLSAAGVGTLGIVKIDVEGYEANVLEALEERIVSDRPCFIIEILPAYDERNKDRIGANLRIQDVAFRNAYVILRLKKNARGNLENLVRIEDIGIHSDMDKVDYLLCPEERVCRLPVTAVASVL